MFRLVLAMLGVPLYGILSWLLFGLIAGVVAKFIMPGRVTGGILMTIALGIVGAIVGGFLGTVLGFGDISGFNLRSFALAVGGAVLVLWLYPIVSKKFR
jgi:uncharacterized membrane protein YeaQ/YmgE (transglycosylase-associated protein family)